MAMTLFPPPDTLSWARIDEPASMLLKDGECYWMKGVMLLAVFLMIGLAFFALRIFIFSANSVHHQL
jgi:Ca2+/H+ antiporter